MLKEIQTTLTLTLVVCVFIWIFSNTKLWKTGYWHIYKVLIVGIIVKTLLQFAGIFRNVRFFLLLVLILSIAFIIVRAYSSDSSNSIKSFSGNSFLKISYFLFSKNLQKEIFEPLIVDWHEEYFEALSKREIWKARWINVRYTYAFLGTMWQKSPLGDFIEFISKFAK